MKATAKAVIGRTITAVEMNPFYDGRGGLTHNPVIVLDNGRRVWFLAEETEMAEYGIGMHMTPVPKRVKPEVIQTACRHCGLDIEGFTPFKRGEWRDRGNCTACPDAGRHHGPVKGWQV